MREWLRLYRVRDWLHFLPLPLAGWIASGPGPLPVLIGGVLGWGLGLAYASCINQAFDDRLDQVRREKNPVGRNFGRRQAVLLSIPPAVACLGALAWLSPGGLVPAFILLAAATVYSAPPRLKRIPILGTFWNLVVGVPGAFFAGYPDLSHAPLRLLVGLFAMLLLIAQLIHEAEDRDDDRAGGIRTVGTIAGPNGALAVAALLLLLLPPATWWLAGDIHLRVPVTAAAMVFAFAWIAILVARLRRHETTGLRAVRLRYRYAALALGAFAFAATVL